jgi:hypothetical protein
MKTPFCLINWHHWKYKKEKHQVTNHPNNRTHIYINIRECSCCGKRQHHMMPMINGHMKNWKDCDFNRDAIIPLTPIEI